MTESFRPPVPATHAAHDTTWMAALASRDPDLSESERTRAQAALETCGACADLFADLVAVSAAIPSAAIPARPRDFTLTAADAARLRPRGLRRWLSGIGSARDGVTFPLAMGLTTLGIAGLLVATMPAAFLGATASGPASQVLAPVGDGVPQAGAEATDMYAAASGGAEIGAPGSGEVFSGGDGDAAEGAERQTTTQLQADAATAADGRGGLSAMFIVGGLLVIVGLALFALRWSARRLGDG